LFFFQAEDGIRVFHVTGVQTCALPIFLEDRRPLERDRPPTLPAWPIPASRSAPSAPRRSRRPSQDPASAASTAPVAAESAPSARSEERRVGKGCEARERPVTIERTAVT